MSPRRALTLAGVAVALASAAPAAAHPAAARMCGVLTYDHGMPIDAAVVRGSTSCSTAKRILRTYLRSHAPCDGSACVRRHSGWTCATDKSYAWPRLASCNRGTALIEAYAPAD